MAERIVLSDEYYLLFQEGVAATIAIRGLRDRVVAVTLDPLQRATRITRICAHCDAPIPKDEVRAVADVFRLRTPEEILEAQEEIRKAEMLNAATAQIAPGDIPIRLQFMPVLNWHYRLDAKGNVVHDCLTAWIEKRQEIADEARRRSEELRRPRSVPEAPPKPRQLSFAPGGW